MYVKCNCNGEHGKLNTARAIIGFMLKICPIAGKDWCRQVHLTIALYYGI